MRSCREPTGSPAPTSATEPSWPSRPACDSTACNSRPCRQLLADLLRKHEANVLLDDLELGDVLGAAQAEEVHQPLNELLGGAGARADPHLALALEPLLEHLGLV